MKTGTLLVTVMLLLELTLARGNPTPQAQLKLDEIYTDDGHCLVGPEIRSSKDNAISCYCRDALVDLRYVYQTYLLTGKDSNLNGAYLGLFSRAQEVCGEKYDVIAAREKEWQWNGPEVTRVYPPDSTIEKIKPDDKGFRIVEYRVQLTYHDRQGHSTKVENFSTLDRLPPNFKK